MGLTEICIIIIVGSILFGPSIIKKRSRQLGEAVKELRSILPENEND